MRDGEYKSGNFKSFLTLNIYLNTVEENAKGRTQFIGRDLKASTDVVLDSITPIEGSALIFELNNEDILHRGEVLLSGLKYILRSDIMYQRVK